MSYIPPFQDEPVDTKSKELENQVAQNIVTLTAEVAALPENTTWDEIQKLLDNTTTSKLEIAEDNLKLTAKNLLYAIAKQQNDTDTPQKAITRFRTLESRFTQLTSIEYPNVMRILLVAANSLLY